MQSAEWGFQTVNRLPSFTLCSALDVPQSGDIPHSAIPIPHSRSIPHSAFRLPRSKDIPHSESIPHSALGIRHSRRGFSLLEVVVALAIVSIGITVALQLFSGALKNVRKMDLAGQAMNYAENVMNEILSDETIKGPITRHDDLDDNFRWEAMVQDFEIPEQARWDGRTQFPMKLLSVRVDVIYKNDKNGKLYRLVCLKPVGLREQPALNTPGAFSAPPNAPRPPIAQPNNPFRNFQ
ncbi:MAG TPA: type II secretion system protein [Acidobacteriota bacterium]|jgi:general secretion pathway protein I